MSLGPLEIVAILLVILLLFGAKKIPDLSRSIGQGIKEFKKAIRSEEKDETDKEGDGKE